MSAQLEKRYFNVDEYYRMARAGVLKPEDRVELIEGEIIKMSPIGSPHAACVSRLDYLLHNNLDKRKVMVRTQNPIRLDKFSEPIPDVAILKPRKDYYSARHPIPSDVLVIIEVANTSAVVDRQVKLPLYARSLIPEVWLVNLPRNVIETYFTPGEGSYRNSRKYKRGETVVSHSVPGLKFEVNDILG